MSGFGTLTHVATVLKGLQKRVAPLPAETVASTLAVGRVLAEGVRSGVNVPGFARAAMDGFAVRAVDAATGFLTLVGHSLPGRPFLGHVGAGEAVRITTGSPLPAGADAVLMLEHADQDGETVRGRHTLAVGRNVGQVGEDVRAGCEVLPVGRTLRPQDVGLLAAIGVTTVSVVRRPRVAVLVTGNELLPPGMMPEGIRIVDSNSPMLAALVVRDGGECGPVRYVPDTLADVQAALVDAASRADVVLVSGGTSVGSEDHGPRAVAAVGELAVHGVAIRPAKPMGIGFVPVPVFLLPGNPVSCLCAYDLFAGRAIRQLGGRSWELPYPRERLPLANDISSEVGRVDYARVKWDKGRATFLGTGGASNLSGAVQADGFVIVPAEVERLSAGEFVDVWRY